MVVCRQGSDLGTFLSHRCPLQMCHNYMARGKKTRCNQDPNHQTLRYRNNPDHPDGTTALLDAPKSEEEYRRSHEGMTQKRPQESNGFSLSSWLWV